MPKKPAGNIFHAPHIVGFDNSQIRIGQNGKAAVGVLSENSAMRQFVVGAYTHNADAVFPSSR